MDFEIGKKYVVKMKDRRSVEVIREYSLREKIAFNVISYLQTALKVLGILSIALFPPMIFLFVPFIRRNNESN